MLMLRSKSSRFLCYVSNPRLNETSEELLLILIEFDLNSIVSTILGKVKFDVLID